MSIDDHQMIGLWIVACTGGLAVGPLGCFPAAQEFAVGIKGLDARCFVDDKDFVVWTDRHGSGFLESAVGQSPLPDHQIATVFAWVVVRLGCTRDAA